MNAVRESSSIPFGMIKSFGLEGPQYEVGEIFRRLEDGDLMIEITLVASGERTEYRLSKLLEDPAAH